ncbi:MAG TPA: response regulator [Sandaracinaceae bacterium]
MKLLLVEDDHDSATIFGNLLAYGGHDVRVATTGREALELAASEPPEVVVCDIALPDMSGWELARTLRARLGDGVVLIALSGLSRPHDRDRSLAAGFDEHVVKPVTRERLDAIIARAAARRERGRG